MFPNFRSVNECICHGIPDQRPLQDGDIVNRECCSYIPFSSLVFHFINVIMRYVYFCCDDLVSAW